MQKEQESCVQSGSKKRRQHTGQKLFTHELPVRTRVQNEQEKDAQRDTTKTPEGTQGRNYVHMGFQ